MKHGCCVIRFFSLCIVLFILSGAGCVSSIPLSFNPEEKDKLTEKERGDLLEYVRIYISSSQELSVNAYEKKKIMTLPPESYKIHYLAHKYGRVSILWSFPANRQIMASYEGPLRISYQKKPSWRIRVVTGSYTGAKSPAELGL